MKKNRTTYFFCAVICCFTSILSAGNIDANQPELKSTSLRTSKQSGQSLSEIKDLILKFMNPNEATNLEKLLDLLKKKGHSFTRDQIKDACKELISEGLLIKNGHGRDTTYTLGSKSTSTNKPELEAAFAKLYPETLLEKEVTESEEWLAGARWGEPRRGHPEGAIIYHVLEVLGNVETLYGDSPMREKLRIIAIIHDTFKHKVDRNKSKSGENHHAMIARRFAEKFIDDSIILDIIEHHDDAYNAWAKGSKYGDWDRANKRAAELIDILGDNLDLYIAFYECDNATGDKSQEPVEWFKDFVEKH